MSDPRNYEGDTNPVRDPYIDARRVDGRDSPKGGFGWVIAIVIAAIVIGFAAYTYQGGQMTSSNTPETTRGQSRPVPSTPPSTPLAPAPSPTNPAAPTNPPKEAP